MRFLVIYLLCMLMTCSAAVAADGSSADEAAIRRVVTSYFRAGDEGRTDLLYQAFQPSLVMYSVRPEGDLTGLDLARWAKRLADARGLQPAHRRNIQWIDIHGDAASVEALSVFEEHQFRDFLSLLKVQGQWRIIGKVFVNQPVNAAAAENPEDVKAVRELIEAQFDAMDRNDGRRLSALYDPRALSFSVTRGELTAVAMGEWAGRFDEAAARKEFPEGVTRRIDRLAVRGSVAWASFSHRSGHRVVVDTALFAKVHEAWRAVHLTYVVVAD